MDWNWVSFLILLICPLMMLFMMFSGKGHGHGKGGHKAHNSSLKELDSKVTSLEKENAQLKEEINMLSSKK
ncbi:DUF2933 domain-containing protein [Lysinibacillus fusiformis]|uniref:DUF2933 domain-containing protein n=1 Tax=Ureibacillus chungkukjangi TaxID=1202712 RepID=UPI000D362D64|nr:DUF2933 domain-containing protein [Ureibacillus chungkukjangi]MCM3389300.1 DUF2933 domain-containing protein [Ureibacillus chungkukjangi]MDI7743515.1 DUF2933 domain-containing protein [Lysinibacillus fusiformis]